MLKLEFIGNLGKDPTMRYTANTATAVCEFSVGVNRSFTDNTGTHVTETTWLKVTAWGKQAEACNNCLKKGSKVYVSGRLNVDPKTGGPRVWPGDDGVAHSSFEVTADQVEFLSTKAEDEARTAKAASAGNSAPRQAPPAPVAPVYQEPAREEIPF